MARERDLFWLWHLEHMGVLSRDDAASADWNAPLWAKAADAPPVTVAIVDSGLDERHPNLTGAMAAPQVDFAARMEGAVYGARGAAVDALLRAGDASPAQLAALVNDTLDEARAQAGAGGLDIDRLSALAGDVPGAADPRAAAQAFLAALRVQSPGTVALNLGPGDIAQQISDLGIADNAMADAITDMATALEQGHTVIDTEDPAQYFGAHATACAGLVGGRPGPPDTAEHGFYSALPYRGVNPFCRILSFSTPYSHEIEPVTRALLAAYLSGAEVILLPRGLPDIVTRGKLPASARRATRIDPATGADPVPDPETLMDGDQADLTRLTHATKVFEALMAAIARKRYLVLTAGNDGFPDRLAYPASAVAGDDSGAIIVGAVNRDGHRASYSNGHSDMARLIHMVSDDGPVLNSTDVRLDTDTRVGSDFDYTPHLPHGIANRYSPWAPLSLDVRGSYGYAASARRDPPDHDDGVDIGSLYTLFGGTSAASALVAGAVSLLVQADRLPRAATGTAADVAEALETAGIAVAQE